MYKAHGIAILAKEAAAPLEQWFFPSFGGGRGGVMELLGHWNSGSLNPFWDHRSPGRLC